MVLQISYIGNHRTYNTINISYNIFIQILYLKYLNNYERNIYQNCKTIERNVYGIHVDLDNFQRCYAVCKENMNNFHSFTYAFDTGKMNNVL